MNVKQLIEEVINSLANNEPLDPLSSKIQVISRMLKNDSFTKWVNAEFVNGYSKNDDIPSYRKFFIAGVNADFIVNQGANLVQHKNYQIPLINLGFEKYKEISEITIRDTISFVQKSIVEDANICMSIPPHQSPFIQEILGECQITKMYKVVSNQSFQNIINQTKSKLIDIFMEFNEVLFENGINFDATTKKDVMQKIVTQTINAGIVNLGDGTINMENSHTIGGQNNTVTISTESKQQLLDILSKIEKLSTEIDEDRTDIADAIISIREELDAKIPRPRFLITAFNSLKIIGKGVVVSKIVGYVNQALEVISKNMTL